MTAPAVTPASGSTSGADDAAPSSGSSGSSTLDAEISALFGGGYSEGRSDESPSSEPGAPPASPTESPAPATVPPTTAPASPGETPAGAPPVAPPASPATDEDDFLKDAAPLTYIVNGETRTFDGLQTLGDRGAFITAEHLPKLQQRLSERDHYYEKDQANFQRLSALEAQQDSLTKLTAWSAGKDERGNDRVLTGADAVEARNVLIGRTTAALDTILKALDDPQTFADLVDIRVDEQGQAFVSPKAQAVKSLINASELAAMKAEYGARNHFGQARAALGAPRSPGAPAAPTQATPGVPDITPEQLGSTVETLVQQLGAGGFTADDKKYLAETVLPRFIRETTPQERPQYGPRIVDGAFVEVVKREAARLAASARTAQGAQSAAQFNARQLAAAAVGRRNGAPAPAPARQPTTSSDAEDAKWDLMERLASGRGAI